ncbi:MAG TPA: DUF4388 domain-containing protein [Ktedonobacteraceae bacterium]
MSFIGSLDQFDLSIILQRIESYKKTGLLVVKQGERIVELSFRQGQLLCIGPVRPDISLAERLLQAGVISRGAYQEVIQTPGTDRYREVGTALTSIDLGHVNQQSLFQWALSEATRVIEALIAWTDGEIYFEENQQPPSERLLIALSISSILPEQPSEPPVLPAAPAPPVAPPPPASGAASVTRNRIANVPTMHGEEPALFDDATTITAYQPSLVASLVSAVPDTERHTDALAKSAPGTFLPPRPVMTPTMPAHMNTAYMQPQMVLTPVDLSAYREQNPPITLTPDQWRLFTRADGHTTLQAAIQELGMSPDQVRQVAGELVALGIITLSMPGFGYGDANELSPVARDYTQAGLSNGMMASGYSATSAQPWDAAQYSPNMPARFSLPHPIETQSQWGNGGNGATFVLGNGWIVAPTNGQPSQPMPLRYQDENSQFYAKAG